MKQLFLFFVLTPLYLFAQQAQQPTTIYPKVVGYMSIVNPIITIYSNETITNSVTDYTVGFPMGINILKNDRIGFSFEITPFIKTTSDNSYVSNFLFHPGVVLRFPKGFSINNRLAFETTGRYGYTPVFSKVIAKTKMHNFFIAIPLPVRFGNKKSISVGTGIQLGITF